MNRSREEMLALAERCEAATGPGIKLNSEIMSAAGVQCHAPHGFTHSLDMAMRLVPEGWEPLIDYTQRNPVCVELYGAGPIVRGGAVTGPLALCAAALRTLARENDRHG